MPKYLTEDLVKGRVRVKDPETCGICQEYTHNFDLGWHNFLCSDECEAAYHQEYHESTRIETVRVTDQHE